MLPRKKRVFCFVPGCQERKPPLHTFPKKEKEVSYEWRRRIKNPILENLTFEELTSRHYRICSAHFHSYCLLKNNRLMYCSVPCINVPGFDGPPTKENSFFYPDHLPPPQDSNPEKTSETPTDVAENHIIDASNPEKASETQIPEIADIAEYHIKESKPSHTPSKPRNVKIVTEKTSEIQVVDNDMILEIQGEPGDFVVMFPDSEMFDNSFVLPNDISDAIAQICKEISTPTHNNKTCQTQESYLQQSKCTDQTKRIDILDVACKTLQFHDYTLMDVRTTCRLCALSRPYDIKKKQCKQFVPLFKIKDKLNVLYPSLDLCEGGDMPKKVCLSCYKHIENALEFLETAKKCQIRLKSLSKLGHPECSDSTKDRIEDSQQANNNPSIHFDKNKMKLNKNKMSIQFIIDKVDGKFSCPFCIRRFNRRAKMMLHFKIAHLGLKTTINNCNSMDVNNPLVENHDMDDNKLGITDDQNVSETKHVFDIQMPEIYNISESKNYAKSHNDSESHNITEHNDDPSHQISYDVNYEDIKVEELLVQKKKHFRKRNKENSTNDKSVKGGVTKRRRSRLKKTSIKIKIKDTVVKIRSRKKPATHMEKCNICDSPHKTIEAKYLHMKTHDVQCYKCSKCLKIFSTPTEVNKHSKSVHTFISAEDIIKKSGPLIIECENCSGLFEYVTKQKFKRHKSKCDMALHHTYVCRCSEIFYDYAAFYSHYTSDTPCVSVNPKRPKVTPSHLCQFCNEITHHLSSHIKLKHPSAIGWSNEDVTIDDN